MLKVAIIGASGYTGGELLRFLSVHEEVEVVAATSRQYANTPVRKVHPHLHDLDLEFADQSPSDLDVDLAFTATPHGASMSIVPQIVEKGIKVVDLSGDYRFDNIETTSEEIAFLKVGLGAGQRIRFGFVGRRLDPVIARWTVQTAQPRST